MENDQNKSPSFDKEKGQPEQAQQQPNQQDQQSDISKSQSAQQPQQASQADFNKERQSDTLTEQRSDIEGGSSTGQADGSFVGSESASDTSSKLVEDDPDFAKDGQGSVE
jgi:hypothetical protein